MRMFWEPTSYMSWSNMYYMTYIWRKVNITIFMIDEEYMSETDAFIWCWDRAIVRIWKRFSELIRVQSVFDILINYSDFIELIRSHWVIQIPESKTGSGPSLSATSSVSSRWRCSCCHILRSSSCAMSRIRIDWRISMDYPGEVYRYSKLSTVTKEYATNVIIAGIMNS